MIKKLLVLALLAGVSLTGCGQVECTPGGPCIVAPRPTKGPGVQASGPYPPPVVAPSPTRRKAGRPTKTPRSPSQYKTVIFLMRQQRNVDRPPLFIKHKIEGRKRSTELSGYMELAYRSDPHHLVAVGMLASMEVRAQSDAAPRGLECWIMVGNKIAARASAEEGVCSVEVIVR